MAVITGGGTADTLAGTNQPDVISSDSGPDAIKAYGGADTVSGGDGDDVVAGGAGDDVLFGYSQADAKANSGEIDVRLMAGGFELPVFAGSPPGDGERLFVVEKDSGRILIMDTATGAVNATAFLDLPQEDFTRNGERGLLGMAFHPDYAEPGNGQFYVNVTNADGDIEIREYTVSADSDVADAASGRVLMTIEHSALSNHNGGWIGFGPDGFLYIAVGDGGGGGDPENDAQDLTDNLLGKILRIDVDNADPGLEYAIPADNPFVGEAGDDEIWAYGLRNPWRASFDRQTGDFYIGDVGQRAWEEVDFIAAGSPGGQNFGWHVKEGLHTYDGDTPGNPDPNDPALVDPLIEMPHDFSAFGGFALTGGYVYRGTGGGQGLYFFADYVTDNFLSFRQVDGEAVDFTNRNGQLTGDTADFSAIASFAEDGLGRLYAISLSGNVFLISPSAAAGDGNDMLDGAAGDDRIFGGAGDDKIAGGTGDDALAGGIQADILRGEDGRDRLDGQAGDDILVGGAGRDGLEGGRGADTFVYALVTESAVRDADRIVDLEAGDLVDLRRIDADTTRSGNQAFVLVSQFSGEAGQAVLTFQAARNRTVLILDVDGDGTADAAIYLLGGDHTLFAGFIL